MSDTDTIIVGGGISGLSCAAGLALLPRDGAAPVSVIVLEAADTPGGKMQSELHEGYLCERGPSTMMDNAEETWRLIEGLGLGGEWLPASEKNGKRFLWKSGRRHALPGPPCTALKAIATPVLSPAAKLRMLWEPFVPARDSAGESLRSFATRRIGRGAFTSLLEPFASGIHAGDPAQLEVESAFPKLVRAERQYGNLFPGMFKVARDIHGAGPRRPTRMRSFREGLGRLPAAIAARLGAGFKAAHAVQAVARRDDGFELTVADPGQHAVSLRGRRLVLALPPDAAARVLRSVPGCDALCAELAAITFTPVCLVHVGVAARDVAAPLDGFGHLVVRQHGVRTLGTIYASSLYDGRTPSAGHVLLSSFTGGTLDPGVCAMSDAQILAFVLADLRRTVGLRGEPVMTRIVRWPQAFPQYHIGHHARCERIRKLAAGVPGLCLIGNYLSGVSVNDCIRAGLQAAREIGAAV